MEVVVGSMGEKERWPLTGDEVECLRRVQIRKSIVCYGGDLV